MIRRPSAIFQLSQIFPRCSRCISTSVRLSGIKMGADYAPDNRKPMDPILKNMFLGYFNTTVFDFPEIETANDFEELKFMSTAIEKFMAKEVNSKMIDEEARIPDETMQTMRDLGLFGLQIPIEYGGLGLNAVKRACISEHLGLDGGIAETLISHETMGAQGILIAGTDEQKGKYLPKLASGETIAAFCLSESQSGSDIQSMETTASLSEDGSHYRLSGTKTWVTNGAIADVFVVFAKVETEDKVKKITGFIVEREFDGITIGKNDDKLGLRGANTCSVSFNQTPVPVENLLGDVSEGFSLTMDIMDGNRFLYGNVGAGTLKHLLTSTVDYALTRKQFKRPIAEFQLMKEKFARLTMNIYVMESMAYLTAGLIDRFPHGDLSLESAAVKIFSSEAVWNSTSECLQVLGGLGYTKDYPYERFLRDARALLIHGGTNEVLRMLISGSCLQFVGPKISKDLHKIAEPNKHIWFNIRRFSKLRSSLYRPIDYQLQYEVHEDLAPILDELSRLANHFRFIVSNMLGKFGRDIIEEQILMRMLADNAIDFYAICATTSRATRSLCIELPNASYERDLTYAFAKEALNRVYSRNEEIATLAHSESIPQTVRIADTILKNGGYCAEHSLTRNW